MKGFGNKSNVRWYIRATLCNDVILKKKMFYQIECKKRNMTKLQINKIQNALLMLILVYNFIFYRIISNWDHWK